MNRIISRAAKLLLISNLFVSCYSPINFEIMNNSIWHDSIISYQILSDDSLKLYIQYPKNNSVKEQYPAIVFFFGGGWLNGDVSHFKPQADYLTQRGIITIRVQYRTEESHGVAPYECLLDARSAMRFIKEHSDELGIKKGFLAAGGGSAGGHLAAMCACLSSFNQESDIIKISPRPDALVLFNPVLDNGPSSFAYDRVKEYYHEFSPIEHICDNYPPTMIMLGDKDEIVKKETALKFLKLVNNVGSYCKVIIYKNQKHGFFNLPNEQFYDHTLNQTELFLDSLGYLTGRSQLIVDKLIQYDVFSEGNVID